MSAYCCAWNYKNDPETYANKTLRNHNAFYPHNMALQRNMVEIMTSPHPKYNTYVACRIFTARSSYASMV